MHISGSSKFMNELRLLHTIGTCLVVVVSCLMLVFFAQAQTPIRDLQAEIDAGQVNLVAATGNGKSTGMVITAYLENKTSASKRININLNKPLFLVNSGRGQNMTALQVYLSDGEYSSDGKNQFITLGPTARTPVVFVAFCVDFDRDNPSYADRFTVGSTPSEIRSVLANIRTYMIANPDEDIGPAGQAAIWMVQGVSISKIRERFAVSYAEERLARQFLR